MEKRGMVVSLQAEATTSPALHIVHIDPLTVTDFQSIRTGNSFCGVKAVGTRT
jgi:hypothetical protein